MKHFYTKALLILVALFACENVFAIDNTIIAFLKENPKANITNCTSEDLMNLLTEESLEWIESIECNNVNLNRDWAGIEMASSQTEESTIKINFKKSKLMKGIRCNPYLIDRGVSSKIEMTLNNNLYTHTGNITAVASDLKGVSSETLLKSMSSTSGINNKSFNYVGDSMQDGTFIECLSITLPIQTDITTIQFYGFRIFYSGTEDQYDISVAVEDLEAEQGIKVYEYYDLMGRRLPEAPQSGVFVRKCGGKVEKLIANER